MRTRDTNLDLLRATAILMVLIYHVAQRWPGGAFPMIAAVTAYGKYGVDLFFVLSGWLIGGLLWREQTQFGNVQIGRFICRRALRTIPPYLAALAISYAGVYVARHQRFDWGYLFFLQNYYQRIPYFLVSWSLCIEEHFYLVMPFLALALTRSLNRSWLLLIFACIPALLRAFDCYSPDASQFGYSETATHLRFEGLLLGVWAAFVHERHPGSWVAFKRLAPTTVVPALLGVIATDLLPGHWRYALFYTMLAVFLLLLLVSIVERPALCFSDSRVVFWIASISYSLYLIQAFTLDAALRLIARMPDTIPLQVGAVVACIALAGFAFYRCIEVPSLAIRHRLMPGRTRERSPLLDPVSPAEKRN